MIRGIIEGFFGKSWSFEERHQQLQFLKDFGYDAYIYAPKSDRKLRTLWQEDWTDGEDRELACLSSASRSLGLKFGIGLSPINLYKNLQEEELLILKKKVDKILEIGVDVLAICFDDMKADVPGLAKLQVKLTHQIQDWCPGVQVILCPSYYSLDPILEKVFGERPSDYWSTIQGELDASIGVFWTGPQVCSREYPPTHLSQAQDLLGDRLHIWDNYPVNDGRKLVDFLHLKAPGGRGALKKYTQAQWVNPMVQPFLSRFALAAMTYSNPHHLDLPAQQFRLIQDALEWEESQRDKLRFEIQDDQIQVGSIDSSKKWAQWLVNHLDLIQGRGLSLIPISLRAQLIQELESCPFEFAREIILWLKNDYAFDPACLT